MLTDEKLKKIINLQWQLARNQAGSRYTEDLNIDFTLNSSFSAATQDVSFFLELSKLKSDLKDSVDKTHFQRMVILNVASEQDLKKFEKKIEYLDKLLEAITNLKNKAPSLINVEKIASLCKEILSYSRKILEKIRALEKSTSDESWKRELESFQYALIRFDGQIGSIDSFLSGSMIACTNTPWLFISGAAGSGKTHLLCEFVRKKVEEQEKPALLFLGEWFSAPFRSVASILSSHVGIKTKDFLPILNDYAIRNKTRFLICIDAINEGHRLSWQKHLIEFLQEVKKYPGLALIISCRTPFEKIIVPKLEESDFNSFYHYGYSDEEQGEAIINYFSRYNIPLPEVPLLNPEFSNPLFLRLFCEALERVSVKGQHKQIKQISSGQIGMTYILECLVREKSKAIAKRTKIGFEIIWTMLKEEIATQMAAKKRDSLRLKEVRKIVNSHQLSGMKKNTLLKELIHENILAENIIYFRGKYRDSIRFTYQRFSDHLIARYLLQGMQGRKTTEQIKKALTDKSLLGSYFSPYGRRKIDANYGVISALIVEFPTRISNKGELLDYLGWKSYPIAFGRSFIDGMYWRDPSMINTSTRKWIIRLLKFEQLKDETLNLLLALSVKPKHPLNASVLSDFLSRMSMADRDLFWTEFIRTNLYENNPQRVIEWGKNLYKKKPSKLYVKNYVNILSWFLTTTQRGVRDNVTKLLLQLGLVHPDLIFDRTLTILNLNDPYVPERMLAVSYGLCLALAYSSKTLFRRTLLPKFARKLFEKTFVLDSPNWTTHILMRDYARGIIKVALIFYPNLLSSKEKILLNPPYTQGGIRDWGESEEKDTGKYRDGSMPVHMDFDNYTLGRLVPGRSNYDSDNGEYKKVRRQFFWRLYQLGYTIDKFGEIDKAIGRSAFYLESSGKENIKTDRYGKKYSWIAFYELSGYRQDEGLLYSSLEGRIADADIDPSFPELLIYPPLNNKTLIKHIGTLQEWIGGGGLPNVEHLIRRNYIGREKGEWLLLEGFIEEVKSPKRIFIFLRGLIVENEKVESLVEALYSMEYPGNSNIPQPIGEYYGFAGELNIVDTWASREEPATITTSVGKVVVEVPVMTYSWESYHSEENKAGGSEFFSKEIMEELNLFVETPKLTIREKISRNKVGLIISPIKTTARPEKLTYIKREYLDIYLKNRSAKLVFIAWGEREPSDYSDPEFENIKRGDYLNHQMIHKQIYVYAYETGELIKYL